jgi:hypothetical protein
MPSRRITMREAGFAGSGFVLGWLMSKTWSDPGCQMGLAVFLVATAVMFLVFVLAVVGHGRASGDPGPDEHHEDE